MTTFSIVTPSFNQGEFIERTIRSVLSQDTDAVEYLVVDGGSTDDTLAVLKRYDDRLRWVSEQDDGQAHAVNKGLRATSGELIGWLNSDDVYLPGTLAAVARAFEEAPDVDVVYGRADHIDEDDHVIESYHTGPWHFDRLTEVCFLCQPAVFFRRSAVERWGMLDKRLQYCMDYEYWLRLAGSGAKFLYLDQTLAGSRMYARNKTLSSRLAVHREVNDMLRQRLGRVPDRWIFNYGHALAETRGFQRARPLQFSLVVSAASIYAAVRWNRRVTRSMRKTVSGWLKGNSRLLLRKLTPRVNCFRRP